MLAATVQLFLHNTELAINEGALDQPLTASGVTNFQVLEGLFTCLKSIDAWFKVFFAMPPFVNVGLTHAIYNQLSHCLIALFRLTTLQDVSWDKDAVRKTIDVFAVLDRFAVCMEQLPILAGLANDGPNEAIFSTGPKTVRALKKNWEAEAAAGQMSTLSEPAEYAREAVTDDLTMSLANEQWLADIFDSWGS